MRLRNEANNTTLIQFNDTDIILLNEKSLIEQFDFDTKVRNRNGLKGIVKRRTGLKNKRMNLKTLFLGSSVLTNVNTYISVFEDNEFFYLDTEGHQARLDGVYAPVGRGKQKYDKVFEGDVVDISIVEKE